MPAATVGGGAETGDVCKSGAAWISIVWKLESVLALDFMFLVEHVGSAVAVGDVPNALSLDHVQLCQYTC